MIREVWCGWRAAPVSEGIWCCGSGRYRRRYLHVPLASCFHHCDVVDCTTATLYMTGVHPASARTSLPTCLSPLACHIPGAHSDGSKSSNYRFATTSLRAFDDHQPVLRLNGEAEQKTAHNGLQRTRESSRAKTFNRWSAHGVWQLVSRRPHRDRRLCIASNELLLAADTKRPLRPDGSTPIASGNRPRIDH